MKLYTYKPDPTTGFEGEIVLRMLPYKERLALITEKNLGDESKALENAAMINEIVEGRLETINLAYGDVLITSVDDLGYYEAGVAIINELSGILIKGIPLGKT